MENNLESKLNVLKKGYLEKMKGLVLGFKDILNDFEQFDFNELYSKVHTISGTSGMYGFLDLSEKSTDFELYLKDIKNNNKDLVETELKEKLSEYIVNIEKVILEG